MEEVKNEEVADERLELVPVTKLDRLKKAIEYLGGFLKVTIKTREQYDEAAAAVRKIKSGVKSLDKDKKEITADWAKKKKDVDSVFKEYSDKLTNGCRTIESGMTVWYLEDERKTKAANALLEVEAQKKRDKAELKASEELEKADEYRKEGREDMAEKAEIRADANIEKADMTVAPVRSTYKAAGTSMVPKWVANITNKKEAVEYLLSQPDLEIHVLIDIKKIEKLQNTAKGKKVFPGIKFKKDLSVRSRG